MIDDNWRPRRTIGTFTRRSETGILIETYHDGYQVNEAGAFIWSMVGGEHSVADITAQLAGRYELDAGYAHTVLVDFLTELRDRGFISKD
ncbi:PqqD family protein [Streptosporangium sp. NPDC051022]|uniref:PqqD family protein n=1 Tax=Streptosporangium sp. NPDC051022 TaxID=3155752 RepID=UPI003431DB58